MRESFKMDRILNALDGTEDDEVYPVRWYAQTSGWWCGNGGWGWVLRPTAKNKTTENSIGEVTKTKQRSHNLNKSLWPTAIIYASQIVCLLVIAWLIAEYKHSIEVLVTLANFLAEIFGYKPNPLSGGDFTSSWFNLVQRLISWLANKYSRYLFM